MLFGVLEDSTARLCRRVDRVGCANSVSATYPLLEEMHGVSFQLHSPGMPLLNKTFALLLFA